MKKILFALAFVTALSLSIGSYGLDSTVYAEAATQTELNSPENAPSNGEALYIGGEEVDGSVVQGTVMGAGLSQNGDAIAVMVTCASTTLEASLNPYNNQYYIPFELASCPEGSAVTVTATQGGNTVAGQGTILDGYAIVDVSLVPIAAVPEMGTVAAMGAVGAVGAMFFMARRKQMQNG